ITQPIFMGGLIRYFSPASNMSIETAFLYVGGIVICSIGNVVSRQSYMMSMFHIGMKMRIAACSLIYRKTLKLSMSALRETTVGQSVNLLSNDVNRFDSSVIFLVYLWCGPLQTLIMLYLMWREIGFSALIGISTILLVIPIQAGFGKMLSHYRLQTAKRTDERIRFMNEIIVGIQVIKMYAWEKPFAHLVALARKREIRAVRSACYVRGSLLSFQKFSAKIAIFVSIVTYAAVGNNITAEKMFVVIGYINILIKAMTDYLPRAVAQLSEVCVSIQRIQKFLLYEEVAETTKLSISGGTSNIDRKEKELVMNCESMENNIENLDATKSKIVENDKNKIGIKVINVTAKWSEDLNENALTDVRLDVKPGGLAAVIGPVGSGKTSLLLAILKELPLISGSILVGGTISYASQEAWLFTGSVRQNILAVYKEADLYILDDPLSAVDTHVGRHLFDDCISDFLHNKTRLLVTHQLQYLQTVDNILILNNVVLPATGTYQELRELDIEFAKQLHLEDEDMELQATVSGVKSEISLHSLKRHNSESSQQHESYEWQWFLIMAVLLISVLAQVVVSGGDYWLSFWTNVEEQRSSNKTDSNSRIHNTSNNTELDNEIITTNNNELGWMPSTDTCIYIYVGFIVCIIILTLSSSFSFFALCMRSSINLHNKMFDTIIHATMDFFTHNPSGNYILDLFFMFLFLIYPEIQSGQILNRFTKDMGAIDELLPLTLQDSIQRMLMILGVVIIVSIINYWLLIPTVVMLLLFYLLRLYYGATSRSVKRLEGITRSPVFSHLNASLQGLTTIRAYGAQTLLVKEFDNHQDLHTSAHYIFVAANRAFGLWLDSICCVYIAVVSLSFLVLGGDKYGGDVGLAITQATTLTGMLQWGIRQIAELENQMTSVERVLEYTTVKKEPSEETSLVKKVTREWPSKGEIVFNNVFLSYSMNELPVLKNVNFSITTAEKVGIVGRTGAGKSSLITALFRLVELSDGSIKIDGIDISTIGLHDLRSKISIIPQEPALFSGLLRENLDPFDQYSDAILWSALEEVELKQAVEELPAGLSHKVSEGGSNFSVGQRQLLCLARAIIRNNQILVLDEATANVDPQTDELIQKTIRAKFADCTVLTIAHRLHTVMDSDQIIVMDAGSVAEFDHPYVLLKNENGHFFKMVQQTGHAMAESLFKTAQTNYKSKQKS
ncbi:hypothetical protein L9F63_002029, partial [Diploptera punctata]